MYSSALQNEYEPYCIEYSRGLTELQVQFGIGIPNAPGGVHVSSPYLSCLEGSVGVWVGPDYMGVRTENPPTSWHSSGGSQEGRCLIVLGALLGALPADAPAEPGASSAAKRA